jgi:hypothetical protein
MKLYHYTSPHYLRGIARYGLTVGDVPTNLQRNLGRVGVWLTSAITASGHGLENSIHNKTQYRLTVEVPENSSNLVKWSEWAPKHVTAETVKGLHETAAGYESWYVFFGVIESVDISSCTETMTGTEVSNWGEVSPADLDMKGVPAWRRDAWHRQLLKKVDRALKATSVR